MTAHTARSRGSARLPPARATLYTGGMRRGLWILALLLVWHAAPAGALEPGDKAPEFLLNGSDGKAYSLAGFAGTRGLVLAWFPKAFTPG